MNSRAHLLDGMTVTKADLLEIHTGIEAAQAHLARLRQAMDALEEAGMYPAIPTEQWQGRNGSEPVYLYMIFRFDHRRGGYTGPDSKRKVYVGNKPARIAEARRLAKNREIWERLRSTSRRLGGWLAGMESDLSNLVYRSKNWPQLDPELWMQLKIKFPDELMGNE